MLATRAFHRMAVSLPRLKGFFGGSGRDLLCKEAACDDIIGLTQKAASDVTVLYLGTATYDNDGARRAQTDKFDYAGCKVVSLDVVWDPVPGPEEIENKINSADIIVVSGGNTLYAVDTWRKLNIDTHLKKAMERGAVLSGGSAGAICWFDGGHSDSMDPSSYKKNLKQQDEVLSTSWTYIRVDALGFLPGLLCPHHDRVQSNGVLRATDFDEMLKRHKGERGIGIDHFAALVVDGEDYRVIDYGDNNKANIGVWIKEVSDDGETVTSRKVPVSGKLTDILAPAQVIVQDPKVEICRSENV